MVSEGESMLVGTLSESLPASGLLVGCAIALASIVAAAQAQERAGKEVVDASCVNCHGTGVKGAPRIGDNKAWAKLEARGLTSLQASAIKGIREMPPHGGNPGFSDAEVGRAITYMVNRSGGHWKEPISRTARELQRSGEQIVRERCSECHAAGKGGAPRIGDQAAWIPRVKDGLDVAVRSAINGHGAMPPRGGMADLTDTEVRNAIVYMMSKKTGPAN
jgi:cytochrome c5